MSNKLRFGDRIAASWRSLVEHYQNQTDHDHEEPAKDGTGPFHQLHEKMRDRFGLPELSQTELPEVFGPYHWYDEAVYWRYDPAEGRWSTRIDYSSGGRTESPLDEALRWFRMHPKPRLPSNRARPAIGEEFVFDGFRLVWVFIPVLQRWEAIPAAHIDGGDHA